MHDDEARFLDLALRNPSTLALFGTLKQTALPNWTIVSGCLFQAVWNGLTDRPPAQGIRDYDVFYFDGDDRSKDGEQAWGRRVRSALGDRQIPIEVCNQARVHLWYPAFFGHPYAPLGNQFEGIHRFLAPACAFGLYPGPEGKPRVYAPFGYDDVFDMLIRPGPDAVGKEHYEAKVARWRGEWPTLRAVEWDGPGQAERRGGRPG